MSAEYDKRIGFVYVVDKELMPFAVLREIEYFDRVTDKEEEEIRLYLITKKQEEKEFKRICFIKTLSFPLEYLLSKFFLQKEYSVLLIKDQKVYFKFLTNRMDLDTVKKTLTQNALEYKD